MDQADADSEPWWLQPLFSLPPQVGLSGVMLVAGVVVASLLQGSLGSWSVNKATTAATSKSAGRGLAPYAAVDFVTLIITFFYLSAAMHFAVSALSVRRTDLLDHLVWTGLYMLGGVACVGSTRTVLAGRAHLGKAFADQVQTERWGAERPWSPRTLVAWAFTLFVAAIYYLRPQAATRSELSVAVLSYVVLNFHVIVSCVALDCVALGPPDSTKSPGWLLARKVLACYLPCVTSILLDVGTFRGLRISDTHDLLFFFVPTGLFALMPCAWAYLWTASFRHGKEPLVTRGFEYRLIPTMAVCDGLRHVALQYHDFGADTFGNPLFLSITFLVKVSAYMVCGIEGMKWFCGRQSMSQSFQPDLFATKDMLQWTLQPWVLVVEGVSSVLAGLSNFVVVYVFRMRRGTQSFTFNRVQECILQFLVATAILCWVAYGVLADDGGSPPNGGGGSGAALDKFRHRRPTELNAHLVAKEQLHYQVCDLRWPGGLDAVDLALAADVPYAHQTVGASLASLVAERFRPDLNVTLDTTTLPRFYERSAVADRAGHAIAKGDELAQLNKKVFVLRSPGLQGSQHPLTLVAFRGTANAEEWFADFRMFSASILSHLFLVWLPNFGLPLPLHLLLPDRLKSVLSFSFQPPSSLADAYLQYMTIAEYEAVDRFIQAELAAAADPDPAAGNDRTAGGDHHGADVRRDRHIVLVGHSLGGVIAQKLGTAHASRHLSVFAINSPGLLLNQFAFNVSHSQLIPLAVHVDSANDLVSHVDKAKAFVQTLLCDDFPWNCHKLDYPLCELYCHCRETCPRFCMPDFATSGRTESAPGIMWRDGIFTLSTVGPLVCMVLLFANVVLLKRSHDENKHRD